MNPKSLVNQFKTTFNQQAHPGCYFAPGRVNIIGEHTDYNGGHVLPCSISLGTYALAAKTETSVIRLFSINFKETGVIETEIQSISHSSEKGWANYPLGIVKTLMDKGYPIDSGIDILFFGDIPNGAGLSSSASIELATMVALNDLFCLDLDRLDMVRFSQESENEFNGVKCGIMDQFASGMGKKDHAILLHADTLHHRYVPLHLKNNSLLIINSNQRRDLADSGYNQRREECLEALNTLQKTLPIHSLCDLTLEVFESNKHLLGKGTGLKRAHHVVYENHRTLLAVEALTEGDLNLLGQLMIESHNSLRDDFEVSTPELDYLVNLALEHGALGSRIMGAGFGGCTINLLPQDKRDSFMTAVAKRYRDQTGYSADFYTVQSDNGARKLTD